MSYQRGDVVWGPDPFKSVENPRPWLILILSDKSSLRFASPNKRSRLPTTYSYKAWVDEFCSWSMNNDRYPFGDEEYMTVTLTTTPHDAGVTIDDADWIEGGMPRQSYASPWTVASPKDAALVRRQGRLAEPFVQEVVSAVERYLEPPEESV